MLGKSYMVVIDYSYYLNANSNTCCKFKSLEFNAVRSGRSCSWNTHTHHTRATSVCTLIEWSYSVLLLHWCYTQTTTITFNCILVAMAALNREINIRKALTVAGRRSEPHRVSLEAIETETETTTTTGQV